MNKGEMFVGKFELGVKCVEMEMPIITEVTTGYAAVEI